MDFRERDPLNAFFVFNLFQKDFSLIFLDKNYSKSIK
jgi:hypothetical protein